MAKVRLPRSTRMRAVPRLARALVVPIAIAGCAERLAPQSEVTKLRVFAVGADRPECAPGETVTVTALWADPEGDGRPVGFVWMACMLEPGADPDTCTQAGADATFVGAGEGVDEVEVQVPSDALEGDVEEATLLVSVLVCAGGLPDLAETEEIVCPEDEFVLAYKRITVSRRESPNHNPDIDSVSFAGVGWTAGAIVTFDTCPTGDCGGYEIVVLPEDDAVETYLAETPDGPAEVEEELLVSFFATRGEFDRVRTVDSDDEGLRAVWRAPRTAGDVTFWLVLRDGRGGTGWVTRLGRAVED